METVSIRNLRGARLRESARRGKPLAITNRGALIGVIFPVAAGWVEHLIDHNWSHVRQSIVEGEQAITSHAPMATLDDVLDDVIAEPDAADYQQSGERRRRPERSAVPLVAAMVSGNVAQAPQSSEVLRRLQTVLNPLKSAASQETGSADPAVRTVRIGDLRADLIEQAGEAGQTLALTHDRELIGIVIPVTQGLVQYLIEENISRVLYNIALGEKELGTAGKLTTLEQLLDEEAHGEQ